MGYMSRENEGRRREPNGAGNACAGGFQRCQFTAYCKCPCLDVEICHGFIELYIIGHWTIKVICYTVKEIPRSDRHCEFDQFWLDVSRIVANV